MPRPRFPDLTAALSSVAGAAIDLRIWFLEDLSPQNTADRALARGRDCDAICLTSAVHRSAPTRLSVAWQTAKRSLP